jgi:hypothetical protein
LMLRAIWFVSSTPIRSEGKPDGTADNGLEFRCVLWQ